MSKNEIEVFEILKQRHPSIMRCKFKKVMNMIIEEMADDDEGFMEIILDFVPDGYSWDLIKKECVIFEIENTNYINRDKWKKLACAWENFDYYHWSLKLVIVNRFGNESEYDLQEKYVESLAG